MSNTFIFDGVKFDLNALKGYTKTKFIKQNKNRFKDPSIAWDMMKDKIPTIKKSKKAKKEIEKKLAEEKVNKPQFD